LDVKIIPSKSRHSIHERQNYPKLPEPRTPYNINVAPRKGRQLFVLYMVNPLKKSLSVTHNPVGSSATKNSEFDSDISFTYL